MFRKTLVAVSAAALLSASLLALAPATAEAKNYVLRYSDIGPPRGPRAEALMWWADALEKRSNGQIKIKFFWSQSLVKGKATLKAVGSGLADMGTILGIYTPADLPIWNFANKPFAISDTWVGMRVWHDLRQNVTALSDETRKKKVKILFNNTTGPVQLLSAKAPITSVDELQGKKVRTSGGWTTMFKGLGATPVRIGFGELYSALDRGTIDATVNYTPFIKSYKHYEVAKHVTEANMGQVLGYGGGINLRLFEGMSKDLQDILVKTSEEYMDVYAKNYILGSDKAKAHMIAGIDGRKVQFHSLTDQQRDAWAAAAEPFTQKWLADMEKKGFDGKAFIAKFEETRAKYRKELAEKGYPWTR